MRNRKLVTLALSATALGGLVLSAPAAGAAESGGVTTTFTVSAGSLSIASAAATANLGTSTANVLGTTVTGTLPEVTVTDARASLAGWTSGIRSTDFTAGTATVPASDAVAYILATDGPTLVEGVAVPTTTALLPASGVTLGATAATLVTATATGSNQVSYTPTVQVTIDSTVTAGTYAGTITHSVL